MKKATKSAVFREQAKMFLPPGVDKQTLEQAGEKAMVDVYGGKVTDSLNKLRYIKYVQKLSTSSTAFQACKLPPTSAAAKFHSQRTYYQVQEWIHLDEKIDLDPLNWGWEMSGGIMLPILTDEAIAPEDLLKVIRCTCKTECLTSRCSCRKHGLVCTSGCGDCRGETCQNSVKQTDFIEDFE